MKQSRIWLIGAVLFTLVVVPRVGAQVPMIAIYFSNDEMGMNCPGTMPDTLTVVVSNVNAYLGAIEFAVDLPSKLSFITDVPVGDPLILGSSDATEPPRFGITLGWGNDPIDAWTAVVVHRIAVMWDCQQGGANDQRIHIVPNGETGELQGAYWHSNELFDLDPGEGSLIRANVPTDERTWGAIKSLYQN